MQASNSSVDRASGPAKTARTRKIFWWIVSLVIAYAVIGFFVVPLIAKPKLENELSEALHRKVTIETLRVNPFVPSVTVRGFAVQERTEAAQFLTFDELYVDAGWTSLFRLAPVVDEAKLTKPHVRVVRNADRKYNCQDLVDAIVAKLTDGKPPPSFALFNLQLVDGRIDVDDRAEDRKHEIAELKIGIPFISSLAADVEVKVVPELGARVNGAPVAVMGETLPFADTRVSKANVNLDEFDLTQLAAYLPFELRGRVKSALLDTRLVIAFEQPAGKTPEIKLGGTTAVKRVLVHDLQDRPMVAWQRVGVEINEIDVFGKSVDLKSVMIESPDVHIRREKSGAINLERVGLVAAEGEQLDRQVRQETGKAPLALKIGSFAVRSGKARYTDETTTPPFEAAMQDMEADAHDFDDAKDKQNTIALRARTEAGETLKSDVNMVFEPRAADGRLEVAGLRLKRFQPYLSQATNLEVDDGRFDIGFAFKWGSDLTYEEHELKISDLALALKTFVARLRGEKAPLFRVASIEVKGAAAELGSQTASLGSIEVREAAVDLRREKDGGLNIQRIPRERAESAPASEAERSDSAAAKHAQSWRVDLPAFSLDRSSIMLEDRAVGAPVKLSIAPVQLKVDKLSTAKGQRGSVSLNATIEKSGKLAVSGPLSLEPLAGNLQIDARAIDFTRVQRYIDDLVDIAITSGAVSVKGTAAFARAGAGALNASYKGAVSVTDFASVDKPEKRDLAKWKSLSIGALDFNLEPLKVAAGNVALSDFYARIALAADGRLNVQDLLQPAGADSAGKSSAAKRPARGPEPAKRATKPQDISLGPIEFRGGVVDFRDNLVQPNYAAKLLDINGSMGEMTASKASDIKLRAKGERAALIEVDGRVSPLAPELFLDIVGSAKGINLPPVSNYSVKYVGYEIEKGELTLNVKYHIENGKLAAENNIILDQLTFGEKVESPDATSLPVQAAVAILKDRNGVINVDVPLSGSLDDPQFSMADAALQAFGNMITNAATAPLAVLGASFGGKELAYIEFEPGSAKLGEEDVSKLQTLTKALNDRPGVKIAVAGRIDPVADRAGLERGAPDRRVIANVSDGDLQKLADARAQAVVDWLMSEGKVPADRVSLAAPKLTTEGIEDKGKATRVDFTVK